MPQEHEAAGQLELFAQALQLLPAEGAELFDHLGQVMAGDESIGVGIDSLVPQLLNFLQTLVSDAIG
jgi:hypothetical protein